MQTAVPASQEVAQAGQLADNGFADIISAKFYDRETTAQVDTVTIGTAVEGDEYTIRVNGIEKSYIALAGNSTTDIAAALQALLDADAGVTAIVTPTTSTNTVILTDAADNVFTTEVDATDPDNISVANTTVGVYADDEMPFGIGVFQGSAFDEAKIPYGAGTFLGVVAYDQSYPNSRASGDATVPAGGPVAVVRKGRVWVMVEEAIALGDAVYVRHTGTAPEQRGAFRNDADTADAQQISAGARWFAGDRVVNGVRIAGLELNLPQ